MTNSNIKKKKEIAKKKAAIYVRVSSKKQQEGETIKSQLDALRVYADQNDYYVPKELIFSDDGVSGSVLQRPALDELRDIIRSDNIDTIIIYAPDRLSRKYSYQLILLEEFRKFGVNVSFLKDAPLGDTPEAKMYHHLQGIIAEYERALIVDRTRRGKLYKAKQGDPAALPSVPFGYKKVKKGTKTVVEIVDANAEVIRKIYRLYLYEKKSANEIERILTNEGILSPSGLSKWSRRTISDILRNPAYTGTAYFGKTEKGEGRQDMIRHYASGKYLEAKYAKRRLPEDRWLPINIPPIIAENDFQIVSDQLTKNKLLSSRNTKQPALLQGLVMCGKCGLPFYKRFRKYKDKYRAYYYCRSHSDSKLTRCANGWVLQNELDDLVYKEVISLLQNPTILERELARRAKESTNVEEIERHEIMLKRESNKIFKERDRLLDAYQSGAIELKELKQRNEGSDDRKNALEKELRSVQALKIERQKGINIREIFSDILKRMKMSVEKLSLVDKQKLVRLLVDQVVINDDQVKIIHCVSPGALNSQNCQLTAGVGT